MYYYELVDLLQECRADLTRKINTYNILHQPSKTKKNIVSIDREKLFGRILKLAPDTFNNINKLEQTLTPLK